MSNLLRGACVVSTQTCLGQQQRRMPVNYCQDVVEIMSHPTRQLSNGFHFLRLAQLNFTFMQLRFRLFPIADIARVYYHAADRRIVHMTLPHRLEIPPGTILMSKTKLNAHRPLRILKRALEGLAAAIQILWMNKPECIVPRQFLRLVTQYACKGRAVVEVYAFAI